MVQLNQTHFKTFKAECERLVSSLGLHDWRVYYRFEKVDGGLAACETIWEGKVATITLNPEQENCSKGEVDVKRTARHEVIHLLLGELRALNGKRLVTEGQWEAAEHAVVRRLEKVL
jgi:hypothetical protein